MSGALAVIASRKRVVLAVALLLAASGIGAWLTMPRQEDPRIPYRSAISVVPFPGADAETIERLIVEPVEERLAEVAEVDFVVATTRADVAVFEIELSENVYDVDEAWDEVRRRLDLASGDFPDDVAEPSLDDEIFDVNAVVVAVTGSSDPLELADAAERLKERLLTLPGVSKVELHGDPGEQVTIELADSAARRVEIDAPSLGAALAARNLVVPGGSIRIGGRRAVIDARTEFTSIEEIRATPIVLASGATVPLEAIATVRRGPEEPRSQLLRVDGEPAVGVGVVPRRSIDLVGFGERVRRALDEEAARLAPLEIRTVFHQPTRVADRIGGLGRSLAIGILVVAGVLVAAMGVRLGLVVAALIPLVAAAAVGLFAIGGGVLHQMSIAALVIALGMLVDNAIVMAESIQSRLDDGATPRGAAVDAVRDLALPLGSATATTIAAFVPMLTARGATGDFTRAIPIVIVVTLAVSYLYAIFVTPAVSAIALRARPADTGARRGARLGHFVGGLAVRRPLPILLAAVALVGVSVWMAGHVRQVFFPSADRDQLVVDLQLPEGTAIDRTAEASARLERELLAHDRVTSVAASIGHSVPRFYYNVTTVPNAPHLAQLVATTDSLEAVDELVAFVREWTGAAIPEALVVPRRLEQGPPVEAPIVVRVFGNELGDLHDGADAVLGVLRSVPGTADARHDMGLGAPHLRFDVDESSAARLGFARGDVARALAGRTLGLPVGRFRGGDDPVPIVIRSREGESFPASELEAVDVAAPGGPTVPVAKVARAHVEWRPASITRRGRERVVQVLAELEPGYTFSDVLRVAAPRIEELELSPGVRVDFGGQAEKSSSANASILRGMPIAAMLLLGFLLAEFNSFRRLAIVLSTVPLAITGVVPGLLIADQPFGFMSLLGAIALVGIVVNNAIVMLDVVERRRGEGLAVPDAVRAAVRERLRPILLTTVTTVAGLMPLALSPTTLWPPLAWAMISGLIASTMLTLGVVPALYTILFPDDPRRPLAFVRSLWRPAAATATWVSMGLAAAGPGTANAATPAIGFAEAMQRAAERPLVEAAREREAGAASAARAERRGGLLPGVRLSAATLARDRELELETPFGPLSLGDGSFRRAEALVEQPLLDLRQWRYETPAARAEAFSAREQRRRVEQVAAADAAYRYLDVLEIDAAREATRSFVASLEARLAEARVRVREGRLLNAERLKIELAFDRARQDGRELDNLRRVATARLARAVGADGRLEPTHVAAALIPISQRPNATPERAVVRAVDARPDLDALRAGIRAATLRGEGVRAEAWPRLLASARWSWSDAGQYTAESWTEGAIVLAWDPFSRGTRGPRAAARAAEARALDAELRETLDGLRIELESAFAALDIARGEVEVGESAVRDAGETRRVERVRFREGRATTNDLLDAEAALREAITRRDVARVRHTRAWIRLGLAMGEELASWLPKTAR